MKRRVRKVTASVASAVAFTVMVGVSSVAHAQGTVTTTPAPPPPPATATGEATGNVQVGGNAQGGGAMTLPPPAAEPRHVYVAPGNTDHDGVVGTFAIGYLGLRSIAVGAATATGTADVATPIIGGRYWLTNLIGIDAGLGLGIVSRGGSGTPRSDWGFLLHGGVPLALASSGHFTFEVIPELNFGFAGSSQDVGGGGGSNDGSGFHFDVGARAGAEIQFGFIGIPQLSLQGTIGLALAVENTKLQPPGNVPSTKTSTVQFATSVQDSPWNIFTSNVAALYYF